MMTHCHRITPIMRTDKNGNFVLMLANMSFDESGTFTIEVRTDKKNCNVLLKDGSVTTAKVEDSASGIRISIDSLKPWEEVILSNL